MYETVCKERFDKLEKMHEETICLLRGRNGNPGIVEEVHTMKRTYRTILGILAFVGSAVGLEVIGEVYNWISHH